MLIQMCYTAKNTGGFMAKLNKDGLEPGSMVSFETMQRVNSERKNKKPENKKARKAVIKVTANEQS